MKIRSGFVSNSSTSSFSIFGILVSPGSEEEALLREAYSLVLSENTEKGEEDSDEDDPAESESLYGVIEQLLDHYDLDSYPDGLYFRQVDSGDIYLGLRVSEMKDEQTLREFKDLIKAKLSKLLGPDITIEYHSEAWYDG